MSAKLGRQGYALVYTKIDGDFDRPWVWTVESQNGQVVAHSHTSFRAKWDARRQALRLFNGTVAAEKTVVL